MTIEQIKALAQCEPFRSFVIVLKSGEEIPVNSDTELLFPRKRPQTVYVFANGGASWIFEAQAVSALNQNDKQRIPQVKLTELKSVLEREPFRPFSLRLSNGAVYEFNEPRDLGVPRVFTDTLFYFGGQHWVLIDVENIVEILNS